MSPERIIARDLPYLLRRRLTIMAPNEVTEMAKTIVAKHQNWWRDGNQHDLVEAAWFGIAELDASNPDATHHELWNAGVAECTRDMRQYREIHFGIREAHRGKTRECFMKYWCGSCASCPQDAIVEKIALWQVLAAMEPYYRNILVTLANNDNDMKATAGVLCISVTGFAGRLSEARQRFRVLWFDRETPSKLYHSHKYLRWVHE